MALKKLQFGAGLLKDTLLGKKRITLRRYRRGAHDFKKGEIIIGEFLDGLNILLEITEDTLVKRFKDLTNEEAREDGFVNSRIAFSQLREYYDDLRRTDSMAVVRFRIPQIGGIDVVSGNGLELSIS